MIFITQVVRRALFWVCPICDGAGIVACDLRYDTAHVTKKSCPGCQGSGSRAAFDAVQHQQKSNRA